MNIEINKIHHPYKVPEGYFEELEENVMAQVHIQELKNQEVSAEYFEDLESNILSQIKIESLKKAGSPSVEKGYFENLEAEILGKAKIDIFKTKGNIATPEGYFENLESEILGKAKIDIFKSKGNLSTPEGYFENLEEQILAKKNIEILKGADKLETPEGYFDSLENDILSKTVEQKKSNFTVQKGGFKYFRNAAAILLISAISVLFYRQSQPKDAFADISNEEMIAYLADQPLTDTQLETVVDETITVPVNLEVSDQELEQFIKENNI
ncbi:hypothetical protein EGI22_20305 [Lacihabitans sp. LS3-19]|uniref:hypothetical protein n=1 Tax=Lacihabitans sp. LS3-19 TaxID=2487335 RepID=UPI0020CD8652|nr:hypothetical protein [Lacihabitans sp. LS3-19]MCP9770254.1 hypothetical protein [Lacihabitans sp. LS3-19]